MRSKNGAGGRISFIQAARRRQIIAAAIDTVTATGYGQASLARIAHQAGISKSVISYHFTGKDELLEQVVAQVAADWTEYVRPYLEAEPTATGRLTAYIRSRLGYMRAHRTSLVAVAEIVMNHRGTDGRLVFAEHDSEPPADLLTVLRDGRRSGEFRDLDPVVVAMTINQGIDGALAYWADHPDTDLTAYGGELVRLFGAATRTTSGSTS